MSSTHQRSESIIKACFEIKKVNRVTRFEKKLLDETLYDVQYQAKNDFKK